MNKDAEAVQIIDLAKARQEENEPLTISKVEGLFRHPLKSGKAEPLEEILITESGPSFDRNWAIRKPDGEFLSQGDKEGQRLALVKATVTEEGVLQLEAPGIEPIRIEQSEGDHKLSMKIWYSQVVVIDEGDTAALWFKRFLSLGEGYRLVRMSEAHPRQLSQTWIDKPEGTVSLADGYPILLSSISSLVDLNNNLERPVTIDRFRANIVVSGCAAWEEDTWEVIQIGEVVFDFVKPCARCAIPSVDQKTAEIVILKEPLRTLTKIRSAQKVAENAGTAKYIENKGGFFGWNLVPRNKGVIKRSNKVIVLKKRERQLPLLA